MALNRPSRALAPILAATLAMLVAWLPDGVAAAPVPGCPSFASQAAAQEYFAEHGGGPRNAVGNLDPDRDGIACEGAAAPYGGFATLGYNLKKRFLYGTVSMPEAGSGGERFPCLEGNRHFADGPRLLRVFRVQRGGDRVVVGAVGAEARPGSGRLLWKAEKEVLLAGRYYVAFEERVALTPYGQNECPGFRSAEIALPQPPRR